MMKAHFKSVLWQNEQSYPPQMNTAGRPMSQRKAWRRAGHAPFTPRRVNREPMLPTAIKAEDEKILEEYSTGNQTGVEEKSLVDTVYALKDEVKALRSKMAAMCTQMQEERSARSQLQSAVHNLLTTSPKT